MLAVLVKTKPQQKAGEMCGPYGSSPLTTEYAQIWAIRVGVTEAAGAASRVSQVVEVQGVRQDFIRTICCWLDDLGAGQL